MRILRMAALTLGALGLCAGGTAAAAATTATTATTAAGTAVCSGSGELPVLDVTQTFGQANYNPGQSVTVTVTAVNCTSQTLSTHIEPYGRFADAAGNIARGCYVIDPTWNPVTFAPNGTYTASFTYQSASGCTATQFTAYDSFYADGSSTPLNPGTASVPINQTTPPVACHVVYARPSEWPGGFTGTLAITNTGQTAVNGWTLTFAFGGDQQATNFWGASFTQKGQQVKLTNLAWDASIAPGATLFSVGAYGTWITSDAPPYGFVLNGVPCS
ncbi:MAG: hypothetical protein HOV87_03585 [Catenulispora sp.]|nr:hypothetical protein [Catenulispora sp.]